MGQANEQKAPRPRQLYVLLVADSPADVELLERHFITSGYLATIDCVASAEAMRAALVNRDYHVVIADCAVRELGVMAALNLLRQSGRDIPFIVFSDTISDDTVVTALRAGSHDYVLKAHLGRLLPAIERGRQEVLGHAMKAAIKVAREEADESIRIAESRLQGVINSAMDAIVALDAQRRIVVFNAAAERIFGCSASEALGSSMDRFLTPQHRELLREHFRDFDASDVTTQDVTTRALGSRGALSAVRWNGEQFPIEATISQTLAGDEKLLTVMLRDVSERTNTKEALRQSEEELQAIYQHVAVGIEHSSLDGRLVMVNPAFEKLLGYGENELLGKTFEEITLAEDRAREAVLLASMLNGECDSYVMEKRYLHKNGTPRWVIVTSSLVKDAGGQALSRATIVQDIAERKRAELLEDRLHQVEKLESLGQLAGSVAHDFNNLLSVMLGCAELLIEELPEADPRRARVEQIQASVQSGVQLTGQLLAFSRKQPILPQVVDLKKVVTEMKPMLRQLLPSDIDMTIHCPEEICPVKVAPDRIQQVLLNLASNARDAMREGGNLEIEIRTIELDEECVQSHVPMAAGRYQMLAISDTGTGMDSEVMVHLFEPFFTTKEKGKGTGLGLASAYGVVKQCGGDIWVSSAPGAGSIFQVYLPNSEEPVAQAEAEGLVPGKLGGHETILLVEDSAPLRRLAQEVLAGQGYRVLEAADGMEALELSRTYEGHIDLLLTDIVMPRMRGTELAKRVAKQRPRTGIILLSGYAEEVLSHIKSVSRVLLLEKPFTMKMLLQKVRQVLDGMEKTAQLLPAGAWQEGTEVHAPLAEHGGREKRLDR